jgi:hypothetical protein
MCVCVYVYTHTYTGISDLMRSLSSLKDFSSDTHTHTHKACQRLAQLRKAAIFKAALQDHRILMRNVYAGQSGGGGGGGGICEVTAAENAALVLVLEEEEGEEDGGGMTGEQARRLVAQDIWARTLLIAFDDAKCAYFESEL